MELNEPVLACPKFWFIFGGTYREPKARRVKTQAVWMRRCLVCGNPIFTIGKKDRAQRFLCKPRRNQLPHTTCLAIWRAQLKGRKLRPVGLVKILRSIPGGEMLAEKGEVPPLIRDSY